MWEPEENQRGFHTPVLLTRLHRERKKGTRHVNNSSQIILSRNQVQSRMGRSIV